MALFLSNHLRSQMKTVLSFRFRFQFPKLNHSIDSFCTQTIHMNWRRKLLKWNKKNNNIKIEHNKVDWASLLLSMHKKMRSWLLTIMGRLCIFKNFEYEIPSKVFNIFHSGFMFCHSVWWFFFRRSLGLQNNDPMHKIRINKIKWKKRKQVMNYLYLEAQLDITLEKSNTRCTINCPTILSAHRYKFFASPLLPIVCLLLQSRGVIAVLDAAVLSHLLCTNFGMFEPSQINFLCLSVPVPISIGVY